MEPNQNPPSERDWTEQEKEEFFSSQDAITGLPNSALAGMPTNALPFRPTASINHCGDELAKEWPWCIETGIHVTAITPPEQGWIIAAHCVHCRKTVFVLSPYAKKPDDGDYFLMKGTCLDEDENVRHNMYPQFDYPNPSRMGPRPNEWTDEAYNHYWNPLGVPK